MDGRAEGRPEESAVVTDTKTQAGRPPHGKSCILWHSDGVVSRVEK